MILLSAIYFCLTSIFGSGNFNQTQVNQLTNNAYSQGYSVVNDNGAGSGTYDSRINVAGGNIGNGAIVVIDQQIIY